MKTVRTIQGLQKVLKQFKKKNKRIGFVPTMGYFHKGHLSLMRKSKKDNAVTVVSVFVNRKQFSPGEDFRSYPRNKKRDESLARREKVDIMFYPSEKEMSPAS